MNKESLKLKPLKTKSVSVSDVPKRWRQLLALLEGGDTRIILERDGVPVGSIVPKGDLTSLRLADHQRQRLLESALRISEAFADVPEDELQREIDKALAEVRAEGRARAAGSSPSQSHSMCSTKSRTRSGNRISRRA